MEAKKGTLVLAFGAAMDPSEHVRHPLKGDVLGIVKEYDRHRDALIVLDIESLDPQSFSKENVLPLIDTTIDPDSVPVENLKHYLKLVLREQPEQIVFNLGAGLGRKILDLEEKLQALERQVRARL